MAKEISIETFSGNQYKELLQCAVEVIEKSRAAIARSIVTNITNSHWEIGKLLHERKLDSKHGAGVVKQLSVDLKLRYPSLGLSTRNLWDMKKFYLRFYQSDAKLRQAVALLPWKHTLMLMNKFVDDDEAILYYAEEITAKGWSRALLANALNLEMHKHRALSETPDNNFASTLPATLNSYANEVMQSTYNLGFLGVTEPIMELELERRLVEKIKTFLLELGKGFTFIGNQYPIEYKGRGGFIDLLFFHRRLRCLVAFELKAGKFKPEYAGKLNYYLSILDRTERGDDENPSIGIILCAEKDHVDVELSLDGLRKPIGIADYRLVIPQEELKQLVQKEIEEFDKKSETNFE